MEPRTLWEDGIMRNLCAFALGGWFVVSLVTGAGAAPAPPVTEPKEKEVIKGPDGFVGAFAVDGKTFVTGNVDNQIQVWDAKTGKSLVKIQGAAAPIGAVAFAADGSRLAVGYSDNSIQIFNSASGQNTIGIGMGTNGAKG